MMRKPSQIVLALVAIYPVNYFLTAQYGCNTVIMRHFPSGQMVMLS